MKKISLHFIFAFLLLIPFTAYAEDFEVLSETTTYYKTITTYDELNTYSMNNISLSQEITEEEYNNANVNTVLPTSSGTTETTYKRMTVSILSNESLFRYKNRLVWKNFPKVRSYDIIGISYPASVNIVDTPIFKQYYCKENSSCVTSTTNYLQTFYAATGTTFALPSGTLTQLEQTFYFDVEKNVTNTITSQTVYGDYSHATKTITLTNTKKYSVNSNGINLNSSITDYYDSINRATAIWNESW